MSVASLWEIAIKSSLGKLALDAASPADFLAEHVVGHGFDLLPIGAAHALRVGSLPFLHRDPFDRMLVAQSLEEGLTLATIEHELFTRYGALVLW